MTGGRRVSHHHLVTGQTKRNQRGSGQGATVKTSPEAIARWDRDVECVRMRRAGKHWQVIVDELGYADTGHAYQRFQVVMKEYPREDVEEWRDTLSDRYDEMLTAIWVKVQAGDLWAIDRATRILEAQAKLLGANRAERLEVSAGVSELDAALRELEAELKVRSDGAPVPVE